MSFFSTLNYSSCNEDWRTEREALKIGPKDRVLAVTGSGDRPLHLLLANPQSILAIDANPAQGALLHLKIAALRALPFDRGAWRGGRLRGERNPGAPGVALLRKQLPTSRSPRRGATGRAVRERVHRYE